MRSDFAPAAVMALVPSPGSASELERLLFRLLGSGSGCPCPSPAGVPTLARAGQPTELPGPGVAAAVRSAATSARSWAFAACGAGFDESGRAWQPRTAGKPSRSGDAAEHGFKPCLNPPQHMR